MPMYLNQASVYDLHVQTTVCKITMATCFSQFNNNYINICVSSVFSHIHVEGNWKRQHLYPVIPIKQNKKMPITYIQIKFTFT